MEFCEAWKGLTHIISDSDIFKKIKWNQSA